MATRKQIIRKALATPKYGGKVNGRPQRKAKAGNRIGGNKPINGREYL